MPTYDDLRPKVDFKDKDYTQIFPAMTSAEKQRTIRKFIELRTGLSIGH